MIELLCFEISDKDIWLLVLGGFISLFVSIGWTLFLFFSNIYKPDLMIELVKMKDSEDIINDCGIKVNVKVISINIFNEKIRDAINLKIESCFYYPKDEITYHLNVDKDEFLILPRKDNRTFKMYEISKSAQNYDMTYDDLIQDFEKRDCILRIRVHVTDENSGFGKAFQAHFNYDGTQYIKH